MNYDQARQRQSDGRWNWTTFNKRIGTFRSGPCRDHEDGHATKEDAERHFYDDGLADVRESKSSSWHGCAVCDAPTKNWIGSPGMDGAIPKTPLCDEHRTREQLAELHPFRPGMSLMHS